MAHFSILVQIMFTNIQNSQIGGFNLQIDESLQKILKLEKILFIDTSEQETQFYLIDSPLYIEFQSCVTKPESWKTEP